MVETTRRPIDCLVLIALQEERAGFFDAFDSVKSDLRLQTGEELEGFRFWDKDGQARTGHVLFFGEQGQTAAVQNTERALAEVAPALVVSLGIAGSLSSDALLGEVVIGETADSYFHRAKIRPPKRRGRITDLELFEEVFQLAGDPLKATWPVANALVRALSQKDGHPLEALSEQARTQLEATVPSRDIEKLNEQGLLAPSLQVPAGPIGSDKFIVTSKAFREFLCNHDRLFLAVETEAHGVLSATQRRPEEYPTLILKGISDFADERKKQLDRISKGALRRWAAANAARVLQFALRSVIKPRKIHETKGSPGLDHPYAGLYGALRDLVSRKYIPGPFRATDYAHHFSDKEFSEMFALLLPNDSKLPRGGSLLRHVAGVVTRSAGSHPLRILGAPGTGKSTLLIALYRHLLEQFIADQAKPFPFLVDLSYYQQEEAPAKGRRLQPENEFKKDMEPLNTLLSLNEQQGLVFLLDGVDLRHYDRDPKFAYFQALLKPDSPRKRVVATGVSDNATHDYGGTVLIAGQAELDLTLRPILLSDPAAERFIELFLKLCIEEEPGTSPGEVRRLLRKLGLKEVDLFTLSIVLRHRPWSDLEHTSGFAAVLEEYCVNFLDRYEGTGGGRKRLDTAATLAFQYEVRQARPSLKQTAEDPAWALIQSHSSTRNFLAALHVVNELDQLRPGTTPEGEVFTTIFPHRIMNFCREIVTSDPRRETRIMKVLHSLYEVAGDEFKANICYLLGRTRSAPLQARAKLYLRKWAEGLAAQDLATTQAQSNASRFLARTIYVSLSCLGDEDALNDYIGRLVGDPEWDSLNRGFHLSYYGDIPFNPDLKEWEHKDPVTGEWHLTYDHLFRQTDRSLKVERDRLFDLDLYSLLSLAQQRHARGLLRDETRKELLALIQRATAAGAVKSPLVRDKCRMLTMHFARPRFPVGLLAEELFELKRQQRTGWVRRGISPAESVADHTFGCYVLGELFLPEVLEEPRGYSKSEVLRILWAHDIAEAYTGDKVGKNNREREIEAEWYRYLAMADSYDGVEGMHGVSQRWRQFEKPEDINARIARDIDRLENLVQLYIYARIGSRVDDYEDFRIWLRDRIQTPVGLRIRELIEVALGPGGEHRKPIGNPTATRRRVRPRRPKERKTAKVASLE